MTGAERTALVTGGAGYVGSHACKALSAAGWVVVTFDNLGRGHREAVLWGELIQGDLLDPDQIADAVKRHRPDVVLHFASLTSVGESLQDPGLYYRNNFVGTLNLMDALSDHGRPPIIVSSTAAVYGIPEETPIPETHPTAPINPYGRSKLFMEQMLADYEVAHGIRHIALRYFNACGADPDGEIGEWHEPETHLIPLALRGVADPHFSFTVNGRDFATRDGTCIRDYIHVSDLADAHVSAAAYLVNGGASAAINLGSGTGNTVEEIVTAVENVSGRALPRRYGPRRAGDPPVLVASGEAARSKLGWSASHTIGEIVATAHRWELLRSARGHRDLAPEIEVG